MISILAQERLLGFALGSVSMSGFVLHQRRSIYRSLADADAAAGSSFSYQPSEITGGRSSTDLAHVWNKAGRSSTDLAHVWNKAGRSSTDLAHVWNKAVDETLGRLVVYLSSRGW